MISAFGIEHGEISKAFVPAGGVRRLAEGAMKAKGRPAATARWGEAGHAAPVSNAAGPMRPKGVAAVVPKISHDVMGRGRKM